MKILYPFPEPLPMDKARAIQVIKTVDSLATVGVEIHLAYVPATSDTDPFCAYGMACPADVKLLPVSRDLPWPLDFLGMHSNRFFAARIRHLIDAESRTGSPFDAVFVRHLKLAHLLLGSRRRPPIVFEAHEVFADSAPPKKAAKLARIEEDVLLQADVVLAISGGLVSHLRKRYNVVRDIPIVPSATDWPSDLPGKNWERLGRHIVYAGNLYGWKGVQDLIDAAPLLPGCEIMIIGGEATQVETLRNTPSSSGANLQFLGHLPHPEVMRRLSDACIAILPNRSGSVSTYTSPLKLFEYMAAGCAIVASDLPVFREVLEPDDAAWFVPGDAVALAGAIHHLVAHPSLARSMGERLRAKAADLTWEVRAKRLVSIIADGCTVATTNPEREHP